MIEDAPACPRCAGRMRRVASRYGPFWSCFQWPSCAGKRPIAAPIVEPVWATLYTDASYHDVEGGGWAIYARSVHGKLLRHGRCPDYTRHSHHAELAAIFSGLYFVHRAWGAQIAGVLVRSDCQGAMKAAAPTAPLSPDAGTQRLQTRIRSLLESSGYALDFSWVKGHQRATAGVPAWVNRECDRLARVGRRLPRAVAAPSPAAAVEERDGAGTEQIGTGDLS